MDRFTIEDLTAARTKAAAVLENPDIFHLMVCSGTGCHATGILPVVEALRQEIAQRDLGDKVRVVETGCNGFCAAGPGAPPRRRTPARRGRGPGDQQRCRQTGARCVSQQ